MTWSLPYQLLPPVGCWAELDAFGATGPCVLRDEHGGHRLWYTGDDGSTQRILSARSTPDGNWERLGIALDAGAAGETDAFGVEAPCVVATPGGFLMAYAGSDGPDTRLHMATSRDGETWTAHGPFMQRGEPDAIGATHPCLVVADRWWLFYAGYDGSENGRHSDILAAVSGNGASWDRLGTLLRPEPGEMAVREPWVVHAHGSFHMFYVSDDCRREVIAFASSHDGLTWTRRGIAVAWPGDGRGMRSPCAHRSSDGHWGLWFAAPGSSSPAAPYRLWMVLSDGRIF
jgi:Glycosyl hydrolases family 32 N-terminal domain